MAGTFLNFPFDEEIFVRGWGEQPDLTRAALLQSGVIVDSPLITNALSGGGNYFTVPYYKPLGGTPANYDGSTDIPVVETEGGSQSGVAYGQSQAWKERDFVADFVGNDPMGHIVRNVSSFWNNEDQKTLMGVLNASLAATGMENHNKTVTRTSDSAELPGAINMALAEIFGQNKSAIGALVTDSIVAAELENINLLKYRKGVDANAALGAPRIADFLGYTLIVDDTAMGKKETATLTITAACSTAANATVKVGGTDYTVALTTAMNTASLVAAEIRKLVVPGFTVSGTAAKVIFTADNYGSYADVTYTVGTTGATGTVVIDVQGVEQIYALGRGAILTGRPRMGREAELFRRVLENGGESVLATKKRNVLHPNGFTYTKPSVSSPTVSDLSTSSNYTLQYPHQSILIAKLSLA